MICLTPMPPPSHTLSIICISLNEEANIARLKQAIDNLERPPDIRRVETLLIDGGSTDDTVAAARDAGFDVVDTLPGANIPTCRNHGARAATGDWIAYLDADCEPASDWLVAAARWLTGDEPILVGWPVCPPHPGTWVQRTWHTHWARKHPAWTVVKGHRVITCKAFRLLTTRNLFMHRQVLDDMGGFDPALATGEDTDFVRRAEEHGIRVIASPDLRVVHFGEPATLRAFFHQQLWHANRNSYQRGNRGNAWVFTFLYLFTLATALAGAAFGQWLTLLPFCALLAAPAAVIGLRAKSPRRIPALAVLYALYGCARSIDLLGLHKDKSSWKSTS